MALPKFIEIDGKRIAWRDLLQRCRQQLQTSAAPEQQTLFELKEDHRPASERRATGRYREPSLFTLLDGEGWAITNHPRADVYTRVTDRIVAELEKDVRPWLKPWNAELAAGRITRPLRSNGQAYKGINVLMLGCRTAARRCCN